MNLRTRHVLESDENLRRWTAEAAIGNIDILEGLLQLPRANTESTERELRAEINRLKSLLTKHELPKIARPPSVAALARSAGLESEHRALFQLFSKLVHPSSYLINRADEPYSDITRNILVIHLQLYAGDLLERIRGALNVPDEVVDWKPT